MTYPPQPGPPGANGWPGGDPNQVPPQQPYGAPPPGGYPPPDPYAAPASGVPGPPDPYAAPASGAPADPYNAPASAVPGADPYSAPASGVPGPGPYTSNPYSAPPGYPPNVPQPQQTSGSSNTGWIVGGVIGVVVILLAVVGVLAATGTFSSDDTGGTTAMDDDKQDDAPQPGHTDTTSDEGSGTPPGASDSGQYAVVDKLCDVLDLSEIAAYAEIDDDLTQSTSSAYGAETSDCSGWVGNILTSDYGSFDLVMKVFPSESEAVDEYEFNVNPTYIKNCQTYEASNGSWAQGTQVVSEASNMDCYVGINETNAAVYVQDGNITLDVSIGLNGGLIDGKELDVMRNIAEQMLGLAAA